MDSCSWVSENSLKRTHGYERSLTVEDCDVTDDELKITQTKMMKKTRIDLETLNADPSF